MLHTIPLDDTYAQEYLKTQDFVPGASVILDTGKVVDPSDLFLSVDGSLDGWLTAGPNPEMLDNTHPSIREFIERE